MSLDEDRLRIASKWEHIASLKLFEVEQLYSILSGLDPDRLELFKDFLGDAIDEMEEAAGRKRGFEQ